MGSRILVMTGRVGTAPEQKTTRAGTPYTKFRFASQEYGEDKPWWVSILCYDGYLANLVSTRVKKGDYLQVTGELSQPQPGRDDGTLKLTAFAWLNSGGSRQEAEVTLQAFDMADFESLPEIEL